MTHATSTGPRARRIALAVGLAVGLAGCADQSVPYKTPAFGFLSKYKTARAGAPVLLENTTWWHKLHDPALDRLISVALRDNIDLEIARERVIAARAARNTVPGAALLTSSAEVNATGTDRGFSGVFGSSELGLSWMLDPYGARAGRLRAADARIEVADAEVDAARLLVLFNMANAYVNLRANQQILAQNSRELARRNKTLDLTRTLKEAGSATRLEITSTRARVAEIQAQLPAQRAAVAASLNELAVLAGTQPGALSKDLMAHLHHRTKQPRPAMTPDVGIPADLLRNRPDIRIAERSYYAAVADIGVARAALYPSLSLTGAITLNAIGRRTQGTEYFFGPVVQFPDLPLGQTRAAVEARHSVARQAYATWRSTVLNAILEVENALVSYQATDTALRAAKDARAFYAQAEGITNRLFREGESTLTELLLAEERKAGAERTLITLHQQHALQFITLNVGLGAGNSSQP